MATNSRTSTFAQALAGLKRRGSGLLVVGAACSETHVAACRRLLGDDASAERRRLVVLADGVPGAGVRTGEAETSDVHVIDRRPDTRGATTVESAGSGPTDVESLRREMVAAVESFDREADGLAPAELRVCVDSLRALVETYEECEVRAFLQSVVEETRSRGGMIHVHLPATADSEVVERFEPLFDATVEVRVTDRGDLDDHAVEHSGPVAVEQRWHLHDEDIETDWLPL
jgi:hypothetical protein